MTKVDNNTFVIQKTDRLVDNVSRSLVLLTPRLQTRKEVEAILKPISIGDKDSKYLTGEQVNIRYISGDTKEEENENDHEKVTTKESSLESDKTKKNLNTNKEKTKKEKTTNHNQEKTTHKCNEKDESKSNNESPT